MADVTLKRCDECGAEIPRVRWLYFFAGTLAASRNGDAMTTTQRVASDLCSPQCIQKTVERMIGEVR